MIWKSTTQLGIGAAVSPDKKCLVIVANYYPSGNYQNQYKVNVFPPKK